MRKFVFLTILLLLTACGGSNPNSNPNPDPDPDGNGLISTSQLGALVLLEGHVKVEIPDIPLEIPIEVIKVNYAFANFQALPKTSELPKDPLAQIFDTCFLSKEQASSAITTQQTEPTLPELPELPALPIGEGLTPVSAGSEIQLQADDLYTKLLIHENGYYLSEVITETVPQGLTINIPGKDFPAFETALPANVSEFSLSSPNDVHNLNANSVFRWSKANSGDTFVLLIGQSANHSFICYAKDDGEFSFPADTIMSQADFAGSLQGAAHIRYNSVFKDKSLFMPMRGSLELYPDTSTIP
jgi:hypothetical protein